MATMYATFDQTHLFAQGGVLSIYMSWTRIMFFYSISPSLSDYRDIDYIEMTGADLLSDL